MIFIFPQTLTTPSCPKLSQWICLLYYWENKGNQRGTFLSSHHQIHQHLHQNPYSVFPPLTKGDCPCSYWRSIFWFRLCMTPIPSLVMEFALEIFPNLSCIISSSLSIENMKAYSSISYLKYSSGKFFKMLLEWGSF